MGTSIDALISWVKQAKYMIVYKELRPRLYGRGCRPIDGVTGWEKQFDADHIKPLLQFMGDLHQLNRILDVTVDTSGKSTAYPCSVITLSVDHSSKGDGMYFNFDKK